VYDLYAVLSNESWPSSTAEDGTEAAAVCEFDSPVIGASFSPFVSCVESLSEFSFFTEGGGEGEISYIKKRGKGRKEAKGGHSQWAHWSLSKTQKAYSNDQCVL